MEYVIFFYTWKVDVTNEAGSSKSLSQLSQTNTVDNRISRAHKAGEDHSKQVVKKKKNLFML